MADGADRRARADGGTDAAPTSIAVGLSVEAEQRRRTMELMEATELTEVKELTVAQTLHSLPLLLSVSVEAD